MKKLFIYGIILTILVIGFSGCAEQYEVSTPTPSGTSTPTPSGTSTPKPTETPAVSATIDPVKMLSAPSWTNKLGSKAFDVTISDNGDTYGAMSIHKGIVKTPTKNILTNYYWQNAKLISVSGSGEYIAVGDNDLVKLYDSNGDSIQSYIANGLVHQIAVMDNGNIIQSSEKNPHMSIIDKRGTVLWDWNLGISTAKTLVFDYSENLENILLGTYEGRIHYVSNDLRNLWSIDLESGILDVKMSKDGEKLYALTADNNLYSYDKYGNKNWVKELAVDTIEIEIPESGDYILTKPINTAKSTSFVYKVQLLDKNGNTLWQKPLIDVGVMGISEDSKYIIISEDKDLRMYDLEGTELASYHLDSAYGLFFTSLDMTRDASKLVLGTTRSIMVFG
jgi:hypothetical protein